MPGAESGVSGVKPDPRRRRRAEAELELGAPRNCYGAAVRRRRTKRRGVEPIATASWAAIGLAPAV